MIVKYNYDKFIARLTKWAVKRFGESVKEENIMVYLQWYLEEKHRPFNYFCHDNRKDFITVEYK